LNKYLHWQAAYHMYTDRDRAPEALSAPFASFGAHGEAALHGALGKQPQNYRPAPHHLHERHREPDEDSRQDQGEEDEQPSIVGSILKANMEVEAAIELAHDLDASGLPCVCIVLDC
jgi:hypothetical protein